jgi:hypothetical protein
VIRPQGTRKNFIPLVNPEMISGEGDGPSVLVDSQRPHLLGKQEPTVEGTVGELSSCFSRDQ